MYYSEIVAPIFKDNEIVRILCQKVDSLRNDESERVIFKISLLSALKYNLKKDSQVRADVYLRAIRMVREDINSSPCGSKTQLGNYPFI